MVVGRLPAIGAGRQTVMMVGGGIDSHRVAELFTQLVTPGHGTGKCSADTNDRFSRGLLAEPRVKSHQFKNIDRFEIKPFGNPVHPAVINESEMILPEMKKREGGTPFGDRVVRHSLVDFGKKICGDLVCLPGTRSRC